MNRFYTLVFALSMISFVGFVVAEDDPWKIDASKIVIPPFSLFDRNDDGAFTKDELPPNDPTAEKFFNQVDQNHDGKVTRSEYRRYSWVIQVAVLKQSVESNNAQLIEFSALPLFCMFDMNGDKVVTRDELGDNLSLNRLFDIQDTNKDGKISRGEFLAATKKYQEITNKMPDNGKAVVPIMAIFDFIDGNKDGKITKSEFPEKNQKLMKLFGLLDLDNDGVLTDKEAENAVKTYLEKLNTAADEMLKEDPKQKSPE